MKFHSNFSKSVRFMKKISIKQKARNVRKSIRGNNYCFRILGVDNIRIGYNNYDFPTKAKIKFTSRGATLIAPKNLNLSADAEEVLDFFSVLRRVSSIGGRLYIDFTKIETLSPLCALLFTSEIDHWRRYGKKKLRVVDSDKWSPRVKDLLSQMGFNEYLKPVNTFYPDYSNKTSLKYLKLRSGTYGDAKIADELAQEIEKMTGLIENSHLLHEGLTEAMINSKKWAYPDSVPDNKRMWWVTGSYNPETKLGIIMIYDHGIGIPATLPRSGLIESYKSLLQDWGILAPDDAYWIKAAMNVGRTASNLRNRGKGLRDIQQFVLGGNGGMLRIISGKGEYRLYHDGREETILHRNSLNGTLIAWEIDTQGYINE